MAEIVKSNSSLYVSLFVVVIVVLAVMSIGNSVSDKIIPDRDKGTVGDYVKRFSGLNPMNKKEVDLWPESFEQVAQQAGFKSFKDWKIKVENGGEKFTPAKFQQAYEAFIRSNALWAARHTPPVQIFKMWRNKNNSWYSDRWFRTEYGLMNPVKWYAWLLYVQIYSL